MLAKHVSTHAYTVEIRTGLAAVLITRSPEKILSGYAIFEEATKQKIEATRDGAPK